MRADGFCADVTRAVPQHGVFTNMRFHVVHELLIHDSALDRQHAEPRITREELNNLPGNQFLVVGAKNSPKRFPRSSRI